MQKNKTKENEKAFFPLCFPLALPKLNLFPRRKGKVKNHERVTQKLFLSSRLMRKNAQPKANIHSLTLENGGRMTRILMNINECIMLFQSMNDERASLIRVLKYVVPVFLFSVIFNLPKFFEASITYEVDPVTNETYVHPVPTKLRLNTKYYFLYNNCARLLILGIIPFCLLVFFNTKIYTDIQVSNTMLYSEGAN